MLEELKNAKVQSQEQELVVKVMIIMIQILRLKPFEFIAWGLMPMSISFRALCENMFQVASNIRLLLGKIYLLEPSCFCSTLANMPKHATLNLS